MSDYFGMERRASGLSSILAGAVLFGLGYATAMYRTSVADVRVTMSDAGVPSLSYRRSPPRVISEVRGSVVVGNLGERLEDLLNEDPHKIRQYVRAATTNE